jgi:uncharacterized protein (DUF983 family)
MQSQNKKTMFLKKGRKIFSIFHFKCPKCHEGAFFVYKKSLHPLKVTKIHENCPACNLKYMLEPSFYFGAMYVAYGLSVALAIAVFLISNQLLGIDLLYTFVSITLVLVLATPLNLRLARLIWINLFVSYDPGALSKQKSTR